jgi:hypothetical protein
VDSGCSKECCRGLVFIWLERPVGTVEVGCKSYYRSVIPLFPVADASENYSIRSSILRGVCLQIQDDTDVEKFSSTGTGTFTARVDIA